MTRESYRFRGETEVLDERSRAGAPGQFVPLTDGVTHYEIGGPSGGRMVVLVHGFSTPYFIWEPVFQALTEAGFRVLRYDLFGRGLSDRPDAIYSFDLYDRQLCDLLAALGIAGPVALVGISMGGGIAVAFTDRHPERVERLALLSPSGLPMRQNPLAGLIKLPRLGEWIWDKFGDALLMSAQRKDIRVAAQWPGHEARYREQMKYVGFKRALLSTVRSGFLDDMTAVYRRVGQQPRPLLLLWGRDDGTIPFPVHHKALALLPRAEFHTLDAAGHVAFYDQPAHVHDLLIAFLRR